MNEDWAEAIAELKTVGDFNRWALSLARERRGQFARFVAVEAEKRGYTWQGDKKTGQYEDSTVGMEGRL